MISPSAALINLAAACLLAPLLAAFGFVLLLDNFSFSGLVRVSAVLERVLPVDPVWGGPVVAALALCCPVLLLLACLRVWWLFPAALLVLGVTAEAYLLADPAVRSNLEYGIPLLGAAGIALSAVRLLRARPGP